MLNHLVQCLARAWVSRKGRSRAGVALEPLPKSRDGARFQLRIPNAPSSYALPISTGESWWSIAEGGPKRYAMGMSETYPGFHEFERSGWEDPDVVRQYEHAIAVVTRQSTQSLLDAGEVVAGSRVLDVACGPGFLTAAATARGASATGIDFAEAQVAVAAKRYPKLRFEVADASALPFADASFDVVLSSFGMLHFPDAGRAATEAFRVLVPGGRFAFTVWAQPDRAVAMGALLRAVRTHGTMESDIPTGPDFFALSEPARSHELLRGAGFGNSAVEYVPQVWRVAAPEDVFATFQRATVRMRALLRAQSPEQVSRIIAALRDELSAYRRPDGYELPMPALLATGRKPVDG